MMEEHTVVPVSTAYRWVRSQGTAAALLGSTSGVSMAVNFGVTYSVAPFAWFGYSGRTSIYYTIGAITTSAMSLLFGVAGVSDSTYTAYWMSEGTIAF